MEKIILGCVTENLHYLNLSKCILLCVETVNNNLCYILIVSCGEDWVGRKEIPHFPVQPQVPVFWSGDLRRDAFSPEIVDMKKAFQARPLPMVDSGRCALETG